MSQTDELGDRMKVYENVEAGLASHAAVAGYGPHRWTML